MKKYKNSKELKEAIKKYVKFIQDSVISNEVADVIKETVKEHAIGDVYGAGTPLYYNRRLHNNGLIDSDNADVEVIKGNDEYTVRYTNNTKFSGATEWDGGGFPSGYMLSDLLSDGYIARDGGTYWYNSPRPFVENTKTELEDNGKLQETFDKAVERHGLRRK